jgi:hypothetical protein
VLAAPNMTTLPVDTERIPVRRHRLRAVHSYDVTGDELDQIEADTTEVGLDFSVATNALTVAISFAVVLMTVQIHNDRVWTAFLVLAIVGTVIAGYCGTRWAISRTKGLSIIDRIRQRQEAPLGNNDQELAPGDVDKLPTEPPPERQ